VLLALGDEQLADPLLGTAGHVGDLGVAPQNARVDAEQVEATGVGVGERLEDVGDQLAVLVGRDLDLLPVLTDGRDRASHRGRGQVLDQGLQQPGGAQVLGRDPTGDGEDLAVGHPLLQHGDDLVVIDLLALEVALH
jgi:hypothetical protein